MPASWPTSPTVKGPAARFQADPPDPCLLWNPYAPAALKYRLLSCLRLSATLETESLGLRAVQLARGRGRILLSLKPAPRIWDTAPASVILSAIGGSYTDLGGRTLVYYPDRLVHRDGAVGTLGIDHGEVLRCLGNWETTPVSRSVETAVDG